MPRRVDVRTRVGDRGYLLEGGSLAPGVDEVLLGRPEGLLDPVQPLTLVRKVAHLWLPRLMRSIGDDADAEIYQGAEGKASRPVVIGLGIAHGHSLYCYTVQTSWRKAAHTSRVAEPDHSSGLPCPAA